MTRLRFVLTAAAALASASSVLPACSNQGEGERCDLQADNNGNDDCNSGLVCTAKAVLGLNPKTDLCCPQDRTQATTPQCAINQGGLDASPAPPDSGSDAPTDDMGAGDSMGDTPTESASDASGG
jgi:hypothetical protein